MVNPLSYVKSQGQPQSVGIQARSSICCLMLSVSTESNFLLGVTSGCVRESCRFVPSLCSGTLISFQIWELAVCNSLPPSNSAPSLQRSIVPTSKDVLLRVFLRQRRWAPSSHQRLLCSCRLPQGHCFLSILGWSFMDLFKGQLRWVLQKGLFTITACPCCL